MSGALLPCMVFSALRVYAVGGRDWRPALIIFLLCLVPVVPLVYHTIIIRYTAISDISVLGRKCIGSIDLPSATYNILWRIVPRACLIMTDAIVLVVTWANTYKIKKDAECIDVRLPLVTLLLRDGTLYFLLLLILNAINMIYLSHLPSQIHYLCAALVGPSLASSTPRPQPAYCHLRMSSIIISRFFLKVRQVYLADDTDDMRLSFGASSASGMHFATSITTFVGNLGAPLSCNMSRTSCSETATGTGGDGIVNPTQNDGSEFEIDPLDYPQTARVDLMPIREEIELVHA
ncbi:hypothetical protein B0H21DRAFT_732369 [Amylocystis lapponica]|nr:hypothetical protein B0H21DRAFT_732369 [Amylocystis lapponica]